MSSQTIGLTVNHQPEDEESFSFGDNRVFSFDAFSIKGKAFYNQKEAEIGLEEHLNDGESGYAAFLSDESFMITDRLVKRMRAVINTVIKAHKFELTKLESTIAQDTKSCNGCRTRYSTSQSVVGFHDRIAEIKSEILKLSDSGASYSYSLSNDTFSLDGFSCPCCEETHLGLTTTSKNKLNVMHRQINELYRDFLIEREILAERMVSKKGMSVKYVVMSKFTL